MRKVYLGLDLSASPKKRSAYAILSPDLHCTVGSLREDDELMRIVNDYRPLVIAIDAPLSLPARGGFRGCERVLARLGIRSLPVTLPGMRLLAERAISLSRKLREQGFEVLEVYPGGAQDILGLPRKRDRKGLLEGLASLGISINARNVNGDVLDAVTAAYTAWSYSEGNYILIRTSDCSLVLPAPRFALRKKSQKP